MNALLAAPVALPVFAGLVLLLAGGPSVLRRGIAAAAVAGAFAAAVGVATEVDGGGGLSLRLGGWPAPFAIPLAADALSAAFLVFASLCALACVVYSLAETPLRTEHPLRLPLSLFLVAGVNHAILTADLFNLFVAFEVTLISSYSLLTLTADRRETPRALPYLRVNILASTLFLCACGLTYAWLGTLNLGEISSRLAQAGDDPRTLWLAALLLVVVGVKSAVFPLFYWLPRSYPILPPGLAGLYGGLLTKVGVYVMIRLTATVFPPDLGGLREGLLVAALITMVVGGLGALSRPRIQEILSWHIVSQIGFMVAGVAIGSPLALAAAVAIALHNLLVKSSLLLAGGTVRFLCGSDDLGRTAHLFRAAPALAALFFLQALSLAGLPPLSGFWGKLLLFRAGVEEARFGVVAVAAVASFLTLASMLKIWRGAFWREDPGIPVPSYRARHRWQTAAAAILLLAALAAGLLAESFVGAARSAARAAGDRTGYARLVGVGGGE